MDKTIYYLNTCSTCKRIMKELGVDDSWELREIKSNPITEIELERINQLNKGSYEDLFSKRAQKYRSLELNKEDLSEEDYKKYILEEYTFLKRPVIIIDEQVFVGNSKKNIEAVQEVLSK